MVPWLDASVIDPFWKNTRSCGATAIVSAMPSRVQRSAVTVITPPSSMISMSSTLQFLTMRTPCSCSQCCKGRTSESYWL